MFNFWRPPIPMHDVELLQRITETSNAIVSDLPEFRTGSWEHYVDELRHGAGGFFVHIDANFLSRLVEMVDRPSPVSGIHRQVAALMCLAICCDMKINPTHATHEYAFTGEYDPDRRLALFYYVDNLHPHVFSDFALGRIRQLGDQRQISTESTQHDGTHKEYLRGFGLVRICLLKVMEIHTRPRSQKLPISDRVAFVRELMDWMFNDFLCCAEVLLVAHGLWGRNSNKCVIRRPNSLDIGTIERSIENAAWDLSLALTWADFNRKRAIDDPIHLIFSLDKPLVNLCHHLVGSPEQSIEEATLQIVREYWPEPHCHEIANATLPQVTAIDRLAGKRKAPSDPDNIQNELMKQIKENVAKRSG